MIRRATVEDLGKIESLAQEFYSRSEHLHRFELDKFRALWTSLITQNQGVIFLLMDSGEIIGTLGAVKYPDAYSRETIATEFFWYVTETRRGRGIQLYNAYEDWAIEQKCDRIRLTHLNDLMPEKLRWLYEQLGYRAIEVNYEKELRK